MSQQGLFEGHNYKGKYFCSKLIQNYVYSLQSFSIEFPKLMRQLKKKRQQCNHRFFFIYALKRGKFNVPDNLKRLIHHFLRVTFQLEIQLEEGNLSKWILA